MMSHMFSLSFLLVGPFWLLMIFAPGWRWTQRILSSPWVPAPAAALYVVLVAPDLAQVFSTVLTPELQSISELLATQRGTTIAWAHFLAFDLFVGRWIYHDSRPWLGHLGLALILFFTLMLGPLGLVSYLVVRSWHARRTRAEAG
jgi:hypothetical protein